MKGGKRKRKCTENKKRRTGGKRFSFSLRVPTPFVLVGRDLWTRQLPTTVRPSPRPSFPSMHLTYLFPFSLFLLIGSSAFGQSVSFCSLSISPKVGHDKDVFGPFGTSSSSAGEPTSRETAELVFLTCNSVYEYEVSRPSPVPVDSFGKEEPSSYYRRDKCQRTNHRRKMPASYVTYSRLNARIRKISDFFPFSGLLFSRGPVPHSVRIGNE